jgi:hypothetical protein
MNESAQKPAEVNKVKTQPAPTHEPSKTKVETANVQEDAFDDLDTFMSDISQSAVPPNFNDGLSKDNQQLQVGDPVVGMHQGQQMSGQVIGINGNKVAVEWKNRDQSTVPANTLTLSDVDYDYEEETMYIESAVPIANMGFDREAFVEDTDLKSLLEGKPDGSFDCKYDMGDLDEL